MFTKQSGFDARSPQPEMALGIVAHKGQKSKGDDESTLALKPIGKVIRTVTVWKK